MIYDKLNGYICREANIKDLEFIYNILEPLSYNITDHISIIEAKKRSIKKLIDFYIKHFSSLVVEKDDIIVGVYLGKGNAVISLANIGTLHSAILLMKTALCDIHNKYIPSEFQTNTEAGRKIYENIKTKDGLKACKIDELGRGIVSVEAKIYLNELYDALKG